MKRDHIESVILLGLISNGCVKDACLSALQKQYSVILVKDAHSTFYKNAEEMIDSVNSQMETAGAFIVPADELEHCLR